MKKVATYVLYWGSWGFIGSTCFKGELGYINDCFLGEKSGGGCTFDVNFRKGVVFPTDYSKLTYFPPP